MNIRAYFLILALFVSSVGVIAQTNDPVFMTINGKDFRKSEFEYFYNKYNNDHTIDKRSVTDYIELFKNLKLKVIEAEAQGLDKTASSISELAGYRSNEAKTYLEDLEVDEEFMMRVYNRTNELVEISHILIAFPGVKNNNLKIFPSDTLETYNRAVQVRNRIMKGENFEKLIKELSDDPNTQRAERPGYLGWFTGLMLNPIFEEVVFNTPAGEIGQLVRSNLGYHIIKINDKKDNSGQINAAHILILCPQDADKEQVDIALKEINEIHGMLVNGYDFSEMAKTRSKDPGSASRGGELGWFGFGVMIKEFQDAAFGLKEIGEISKPFRSPFGFHIVKLLEKKPSQPFEEKRAEIGNKLTASGFFVRMHQTGIENMKKEYGFQRNNAGNQALFSKSDTVHPTDSLFLPSLETQNFTLFSIGDVQYTVGQFVNFVKNNPRALYTLSTDIINDWLQLFEYSSLIEVKDKLLEKKYPDFRNLIQEYSDAILMFEISSREIWEKASEDVKGLTAFFEKNKKNYTWDEPLFKGYVVLVRDAETKKKMQKEIGRKVPDEAVKYLYENYIVGDVAYVKAEKGLFKKGDNAFVDESAFKSGTAERPAGFQDFFLLGKVLRAPEAYTDIRGLVITDYQNYLEEAWLKELNKKYRVTVYPEVINTIK